MAPVCVWWLRDMNERGIITQRGVGFFFWGPCGWLMFNLVSTCTHTHMLSLLGVCVCVWSNGCCRVSLRKFSRWFSAFIRDGAVFRRIRLLSSHVFYSELNFWVVLLLIYIYSIDIIIHAVAWGPLLCVFDGTRAVLRILKDFKSCWIGEAVGFLWSGSPSWYVAQPEVTLHTLCPKGVCWSAC